MHPFTRPDATRDFGTARLGPLTDGAPLHRLDAGLNVQPGDLTADKTRFSAVIQGSIDLDATLRARGIDTVVIAGTLTNRCCESTARDAMMIGYKVILVEALLTRCPVRRPPPACRSARPTRSAHAPDP